MFDAKSLLDRFLGAGAAQQVQDALGNAAQTGAAQGQDVMGQARELFNQGLGAIQSGQGVQGAIDQGKAFLEQNKTGLITGLAAGALGALVLGTKTGRTVATRAAALGGLALVGGLAYKAYQDWQAGQAGQAPAAGPAALAPPPAGSALAPDDADAQNALALVAIRAMVAAAAADGTIDADERERIAGRMSQVGYDPEANDWLTHEMAAPASIADLAAEAGGSVEKAAGIYAASCLAIAIDTAEERDWLNGLADALALEPGLQIQVETEVAALRADGAA